MSNNGVPLKSGSWDIQGQINKTASINRTWVPIGILQQLGLIFYHFQDKALVENRDFFTVHLHLTRPSVDIRLNIPLTFGTEKLEWRDYRIAKTFLSICFYVGLLQVLVLIQYTNAADGRTDGRTDGHCSTASRWPIALHGKIKLDICQCQ